MIDLKLKNGYIKFDYVPDFKELKLGINKHNQRIVIMNKKIISWQYYSDIIDLTIASHYTAIVLPAINLRLLVSKQCVSLRHRLTKLFELRDNSVRIFKTTIKREVY